MNQTSQKPVVVLVHGLWTDGTEMQPLAFRLRRLGYQTLLFRYPTVQATVVKNCDALWSFLQVQFGTEMNQAGTVPIHLVCHSLGGNVALEMLHRYPQARIGRMVALGTAFRGSIAVKKMAQWTLGRVVLGKSLTRALGGGGFVGVPEGREVGILAGTRSLGLGRKFWGMETPNDGTIAVAETYLDGAKDHRTLAVIHMGLVVSSRATQMIHRFLSTGSF